MNHPTAELPNASTPQPLNYAMLALAGFLLLCGLGSCALYVIVPFTTQSATPLETSTLFGAAAGFGFFGAAFLAWQGWKKESTSAAKIFPPVLALSLAFLGSIFLGTGALAIKPLAPFAFPPIHFLAALLIPLIFIAYAARRLGTSSGLRALVGYFSWGALGATSLAFIGEIITGGLAVLIVAIALSQTPDGKALLERVSRQLQAGDVTQVLDQLLANPFVSNALLIYVAVIIPPVEEALKTLALSFLNPTRTRAADAVLWGIAAGAGFAAIENLLNATALLSAWAFGMLLRVGATTMHVANGALMGQGWYAARVERRWGRLGIAYGASVFFHALWNGAVIGLSQRAVALDSNVALESLLAQGALIFALAGVILVLSGLGIFWIGYAVRSAQRNLTTN